MDKKILLQNLAESLAERTGLTKRKAEAFVRSFFELTEEAIETDGQVKVKSFGTTKIVNVNGRESVNINTGERFQIEGHAKVSFTPDALFRDLVNRPFAHFTTIVLEDGVEEEELSSAADNEAQDEESEEAVKAELITEETTASTEKTDTTVEENIAEEEKISAAVENIIAEEVTTTAAVKTAAADAPVAETAAAETTEAPSEAPEAPSEGSEAPSEGSEEAHEETNPAATEESVIAENEENTTGVPEVDFSDELDEEDDEEEIIINEDEEAEDTPISEVPAPEENNDDNAIALDALNTEKNQHPDNARHTDYADGLKSPIIINNTIPEPHHNWWRTAFILLAMAIVALISYFCGYYRLFCPCNIWGSDAEQITQNEQQRINELNEKVKADSIKKAKADSAQKAKADSITQAANQASKEAEAMKAAAEKAEKEAAAEKAAAEKATREMAAKAAEEKKQAQRKTLMQEAQKYPQLPGKYLITGVLKTRTIRPGENLYMIARQVYGSKGFARYIAFHNGIEDPNLVTVGQRIQLPRLMKK